MGPTSAAVTHPVARMSDQKSDGAEPVAQHEARVARHRVVERRPSGVVEQRHRAVEPVARDERVVGHPRPELVHDRPRRDHRFRRAGGARREHQRVDVAVLRADELDRVGRAGVDAPIEAGARCLVEHDDGRELGQVTLDRGDRVAELGGDDQRRHVGVVEGVGEHPPGERDVERHFDDPQPGEREHRDVGVEGVGEHRGDVVARPDASRRERAGPRPGAPVELRVGEPRAVDVLERGCVGCRGRAVRDGVRGQAGGLEHRYVIYELRGSRPDGRAAVDRRRLRGTRRAHRSPRPPARPRAGRLLARALGAPRRRGRAGHGGARGRRRCRRHPARPRPRGRGPRTPPRTRPPDRARGHRPAPRRADALSSDVLDGSRLATLALRPVRDGRARLVPAGAVAPTVVAFDGEHLVLVDAEPGPHVPNLASAPLADRDLTDPRVLASGSPAMDLHRQAVDEWRVLTAAALVGLGLGALEIAVRYVTEREQFGVPIGSFQSLQHTLADVSVALDGAQLLARKAAWAHDARTRRRGRARGHGVPVRGRTGAACLRTSAALPRWVRVHGGVRHPALLPAGQGLGERARRAGTRVRPARRPALRPGSRRPRTDDGLHPVARSRAVRRRGARAAWRASTPTNAVSTRTTPAPCTTGSCTGRWRRKAGSARRCPRRWAAAAAVPRSWRCCSASSSSPARRTTA